MRAAARMVRSVLVKGCFRLIRKAALQAETDVDGSKPAVRRRPNATQPVLLAPSPGKGTACADSLRFSGALSSSPRVSDILRT